MSAIRFVASLACVFVAGCAIPGDHVVFITKTSLGIDVESTPPTASIAYDRVEGYIGPRYDNGTVPPVAGSIATNGKLLDRQIKQVFATGNAAKTVIQGAGTSAQPETYGGEHKVMFFGTSSVLGIKVSFAASGAADSLTLGYKRKEVSVIPIGTTGFPSVLATLDSDFNADTLTGTNLGIAQFFATGIAADQLAAKPDIQRAFAADATSAISQYRVDERVQSRLALTTLYCLAKLDDIELPKVWTNVDALSLFDDAGIAGRLHAAPPHDARQLYTRELSILNPKSQKQTGLMQGHQVYVCELAKK